MDAEIIVRYNIPQEKLKGLSPSQKGRAARRLFKTLARMIHQDFGLYVHSVAGSMDDVSSTLRKIDREDVDWDGVDLVKLRREAVAAEKKQGG